MTSTRQQHRASGPPRGPAACVTTADVRCTGGLTSQPRRAASRATCSGSPPASQVQGPGARR
jgi:hypothetical protein